MGRINDRSAVELAGVGRTGLENLAGLLGFCDTHRLGIFQQRVFGPLAPVEVEQDDFVAQAGITGDGAAAAVFGVAGMPPCNDHLELGLCWRCVAGRKVGGGRR